MKKYPPFCVHLYSRSYCDFPFCSPNFETAAEALAWAARCRGDYNLVRLGYWTSDKYSEKYFILEEVDVQTSLW